MATTARFFHMVDSLKLLENDIESENLENDLLEMGLCFDEDLLDEISENVVDSFFEGLNLSIISKEAEKIRNQVEENQVDTRICGGPERLHFLKELLDFQELLLSHLNVALEYYINPMKLMLGEKDFYTLFHGIPEFTEIISNLVNALKVALSEVETKSFLYGELYLEVWPELFSLIQLRFKNYIKASNLISSLPSKFPDYSVILETAPAFPPLSLITLAPVQALTKFRIFFSSLEEVTDKNHEDSEGLEKMNVCLKDLYDHLKLVSIENSFTNYELKLLPNKRDSGTPNVRKMLMEARFMVYKDNKKKEGFVFLFDDMLVTAVRDNTIHNTLSYIYEEGYPYANLWSYWGKNEKSILTVGFPGKEIRFRAMDEGVRLGVWNKVLKEKTKEFKQLQINYTGSVEVFIDNLDGIITLPQEVTINTNTITNELRATALPLFQIQPNRFIKYNLIEKIKETERKVQSYECPLLLFRYHQEKKLDAKFIFRFTIDTYQADGTAATSLSATKSRGKGERIRKLAQVFRSKQNKQDTQVMDELLEEKTNLFYGTIYCDFVNRHYEELLEELEPNTPQPELMTYIPSPLEDLLFVLYRDGPDTVGILRKSAHRATVQLVTSTLNEGKEYDILSLRASECGSVLKGFFRALPECIFTESLYEDFLSTNSLEGEERENKIISLLGSLPPPNLCLISHFVKILWKIAQQAENNNMTYDNLAICVGPSLFFDTQKAVQDPIEFTAIGGVMNTLITNCHLYFHGTSIEKFDQTIIDSIFKEQEEDNDARSRNKSTMSLPDIKKTRSLETNAISSVPLNKNSNMHRSSITKRTETNAGTSTTASGGRPRNKSISFNDVIDTDSDLIVKKCESLPTENVTTSMNEEDD